MREVKPPISAYVRALNEERLIGDVVASALRVAREVVVVDSGSKDNTVDVATAAGARVIYRDWTGNGRQKRIAEDECEYHWVLDLDADEIVTDAVAEEIKLLFKDGQPACSVYRTELALAPPVGPPWMSFGRQSRHKLYDRRVIRAPAHEAWDQFHIPADLRVGVLQNPILHYAFSGAAQFMGKLNRNSSVRAEKLPPKSKSYLALRIICGLPFYFAKKYILQQYFRGGVYGFAIAMMSAHGRWLRDVKSWERTHTKS